MSYCKINNSFVTSIILTLSALNAVFGNVVSHINFTFKEELLSQYSDPVIISKKWETPALRGLSNRINAQEKSLEEFASNVYDRKLAEIFVGITEREMEECSITVVYEDLFDNSSTLDTIIRLPNTKQVFHVSDVEEMNKISWRTSMCNGYYFLLQDIQSFFNLSNDETYSWDYAGRYIIVTPSASSFEEITAASKVIYTEHVIGITKSKSMGRWRIFQNKFYWSSGILRVPLRPDNLPVELLFQDRLRDFKGALIRVVTFEWVPNIFYKMDSEGNIEQLYGMDIELVRGLATLLNFRLEFVEPPRGEYWGSSQKDGSWTGLVGILARREGDIGIANMFISSFRKVVIDYTSPYNSDTACFLLAKPPPLPQWQSLLYPFELEIWIAYLCSIFVCGIVLAFLMQDMKKIGSYISISFQVHTREAITFESFKLSTRFFLGFLLLYCFILTSMYSSNLTAFLTVVREPQGIETIKELYHSKKIVAGVSPFFNGTLAASEDEMIQSFSASFHVYSDEEDIFFRTSEGWIAYLQNRLYIEYKLATRPDAQAGQRGYRIMEECLNPFSIALGVPKHSPLKRRFDVVLNWFVQSGLVRKWFLDSLEVQGKKASVTKGSEDSKTSTDAQDDSNEGGPVSLGISHLQGIFLIYALLSIICVVAFIIEVCVGMRFMSDKTVKVK